MRLNIKRPKSQPNCSEGEIPDLKQIKKDKVFQLFIQGFSPTSPEVKTPGLHSTKRYKYFYEWNRLGKPTRYTPGEGQAGALSYPSSSGETKATKRKCQEKQPINSEAQMQEDPTPGEDQEGAIARRRPSPIRITKRCSFGNIRIPVTKC